jgi:hypothetical protein
MQVFVVHERILLAIKRVEFVSDRVPQIIPRDRWCHIVVLNVHAPAEDEIDYVKDNFIPEVGTLFNKFSKYHTKILLGDFSAKVDKEEIFKPIIGNKFKRN